MPVQQKFYNQIHGAINAADGYEEDGNYIVPIIPTMVGVMNGGYKTLEELEKSMNTAHRMDVTDLHPFWGIITSADEVVGYTRNHVLGEDGKMRAEMVINMEEHPDIVADLKSGLFSDLSTGYWAEQEMIDTPFDVDGKTAMYYEKNIVWDHVAKLPNGTAACSQEMGCGSYKNEACAASGKCQRTCGKEKNTIKEKEKDTMEPEVKNNCAEMIEKVAEELRAEQNAAQEEVATQITELTNTINTFIESQTKEPTPADEPEPKPAVDVSGSGAPVIPTVGGTQTVETPPPLAPADPADQPEGQDNAMHVDTLLPDGTRYIGPVTDTLRDYMLKGTTRPFGSAEE